MSVPLAAPLKPSVVTQETIGLSLRYAEVENFINSPYAIPYLLIYFLNFLFSCGFLEQLKAVSLHDLS